MIHGVVPWYIVDTDGSTIIAKGACQIQHVADIPVAPGQTVRLLPANPRKQFEQGGKLMDYTPAQQAALANPPGPGFVWRAQIGWQKRGA